MKIIGHEKEKELIRRFLDKNYESYSFLFEGKSSIGKKLIALQTAKAFLCEKNEAFGCNECKSCKLVLDIISNIYENKENPAHPDLKIVFPENNKEIKINQIREIIEFFKVKSVNGKVVIIDEAEKMNIEASNALLKTLEEPPENSMIILVSSNPSKLLPTILSRVKRVKFKPLKKEEIIEILKQKGFDEEKAKKLAVLSEGSLEIPVAVLDNELIYKYAKDFYNLIVNENLHPEGIITLSENIEKLEIKEIILILDIISIMLEKALLKGQIKLTIYEKFIDEFERAKISLEKSVKRKLVFEGLYLNLKT